MKSNRAIFAVVMLVLTITSFWSTSAGQTLQARKVGVSLPSPRASSSVVFDGKDSVYIFGGYDGSEHFPDIYRYNITSDTIQKVSSLSFPTNGGLALNVMDSQFIYFFGGDNSKRTIQKFNPATKVTEKLGAVLPFDVNYAAGAVSSQSAFIFNGRSENILEFDLESETVKIVGDLSFRNGTVSSTASIIDSSLNGVWIFPGSDDKLTDGVKMFNLETKLASNPHHHLSIPPLFHSPATVSAGRYGYIIGGIGRISKSSGIQHPSQGILRFDTADGSVNFIPVHNFPSSNEAPLDHSAAVYVEKLNRIYIFGGTRGEGREWSYLDDILYIDISPPPSTQSSSLPHFLPSLPPPALFNCSNLPGGISYPHPIDAASFYICRNGTDYEVFTCPRTLLFDRKSHTCNAPEHVLPNLSCDGKMGAHPYPADTSKFIVCRHGSTLVDVYDCPKPLHFYPDTRVCNFQDWVEK